MQLLEKTVKLQSFEQPRAPGTQQYRITVPAEMVRRMGWKRGDEVIVQCDRPSEGVRLFGTEKIVSNY